MDPIALLESILNASPVAAIFVIALVALLVAWQALSITARTLSRDKKEGDR